MNMTVSKCRSEYSIETVLNKLFEDFGDAEDCKGRCFWHNSGVSGKKTPISPTIDSFYWYFINYELIIVCLKENHSI